MLQVDPRNPGDDQIFPELLTGRLERTNSLPTFSAKLNDMDKTMVDIFQGRRLDYETVASYSLTLLDCLGTNNQNWWLGRMLISLAELHSRSILRMVAFSEVFLMPLTVILVFTGRVSLVTPFMYYRFLGLRYTSRRNPYTRSIFYELRMSLEQSAANPSLPQFVRNVIFKGIGIVSNLAPPMMPQATQ